jgi:outer membrane receptor protein involved in Fe transport
MRRLTVTLPLVLAVAAVAGTTTATAAAPTSLVITVKSVTTASIPSDKAPKGASKGDKVLLRDRLVNVGKQFGKPAGAVVGRDEGVLVLTSATSGTFDGVTTLPGGTIHLHGVIRNGIETYSISGGTGRYAHARGTIVIGKGASPLNTYHLKLGTLTSVTPVI